MVVVFLCIYCTKIVHNNKLFLAWKRLTTHMVLISSADHFVSLKEMNYVDIQDINININAGI